MTYSNSRCQISKAIDFMFPQTCLLCGKWGQDLCEECINKFDKIHIQSCHVCKRELDPSKYKFIHPWCKSKTHLSGVIVLYRYDKNIEKVIADIKYEYNYSMIHALTSLYKDLLSGKDYLSILTRSSILVPVPIDIFKQNERGFNQSELISRDLEKTFGIKYINLLKKKLFFHSQVGMKKEERLKNLNGAFYISSREKSPQSGAVKRIVLIDDVMTTGATLEECAKTIKAANSKLRVYGLVFARGQ